MGRAIGQSTAQMATLSAIAAFAGMGQAVAQSPIYYFDELDRAVDLCHEILASQSLDAISEFPGIQASQRSLVDGETWNSFEDENRKFGIDVLVIETSSTQVYLKACSATAIVFLPGSRDNIFPSDMTNRGSKMVNDAIAAWHESYLNRRAESGQLIKVRVQNDVPFERVIGNVGAQCFEDGKVIITGTVGQNVGHIYGAFIEILSADELRAREISELDGVMATCNLSGGQN